jgi:hypothetical protein
MNVSRIRAMKLTVQAIALGELSKPERFSIIASSWADAAMLHPKWSMDVEELVVEIAVSYGSDSSSDDVDGLKEEIH